MMLPTATRFRAAQPRPRWAPQVGAYPGLAPATGTIADLVIATPAAPVMAPPQAPAAGVAMPSAADGMRPAAGVWSGGGGDPAGQPSIPSPNQDRASAIDAALTGIGMILGGPLAMAAALPAMVALAEEGLTQPALGPMGALGQLLGMPSVGQMVSGWLGGGEHGGYQAFGGPSGGGYDPFGDASLAEALGAMYGGGGGEHGGGGFAGSGSASAEHGGFAGEEGTSSVW